MIGRYFRYWGKAKQTDNGKTYHLLAFHSLDVAAMGKVILDKNLFNTDAMIANLGCEKTEFIDFFCYLLALHDIGKFASAFQNLVRFETDELVKGEHWFEYGVKHDCLGYLLWIDKLSGVFRARHSGTNRNLLKILIEVVTGHHGKPPKIEPHQDLIDSYFSDDDIEAASEFLVALDFLLPAKLPPIACSKDLKESLKAASWLLSGITTIADWLGSDAEIFKYRAQPQDLQEYFNKTALKNAENMLSKIGYGQQVSVKPYTQIKDLFEFIKAPTPLQQFAAEVKLTEGPQLFLMEDITGAGKTESALILVQRLMTMGAGNGVYIAMPTMATSNAMFKRMADDYAKLFAGDKKPSLALAHGARHLSDKFSDMLAQGLQAKDLNYSDDEQTASAWCNYWYVDNRKKSLLADVGVGTVDQALLSALPTKHQSLRLLGLASKILVIDEIHSYQTYETRLIENLIEFHTRLGGSTILLSATMPFKLRQSMVKAYYDGLGQNTKPLKTENQFPWVTHCTPLDKNEGYIEPRQAVVRDVPVVYHNDEQALWQLVESSLKQGKSVVWVKNTVNETIECYHQAEQKLKGIYKGITLFHSRFCMSDRIETEEMVLKRFGKKSTRDERFGQLLISSPILDQSLDVDLTIMISDIAPIDVLIQRLGRCCRHLRDIDENIIENPTDETKDGRDDPVLHLYGPTFVQEPQEDWLAKKFIGTQAVYRDPSIIWHTARILDELKAINMPNDARKLIEAVYCSDAKYDIPIAFNKASERAQGDDMASRLLADINKLAVDQGYSYSAGNDNWADETKIPTRLAEDSNDFILLIAEGDKLKFYCETDRYPLDMNKIALYEYYLLECKPSLVAQYQTQLDELEQQHPAFKYAKPLIFTQSEDGVYKSVGMEQAKGIDEQQEVELLYDNKMGLRKESQA